MIHLKIVIYMSKSGSSKGKRHTVLMLKELHLTPLYIYMIKEDQQLEDASFTIEMQKDDKVIADTGQLSYIQPTQQAKHPALEFNSVRFIFNVKNLFRESETVKIKLKLTAFVNDEKKVLQEFQVHLLQYSYEYSKQRMVTHKENSIGRIRKYILHYSFSAIYDRARDEPNIIMKYGNGIKEEDSGQGSSVFDIVIKGAENSGKKKKDQSALVIVQNVVQFGMAQLTLPGGVRDDNSEMDKSIIMESSIKEAYQQRNAPRSVLLFADDPVRGSTMSNITEPEIAEELKQTSSVFATWLVIAVSVFLIYLLMHPSRRV